MSMIDNDIDLELLTDFLEESIEGLDTTSSLFVQLEQNPDDLEIIQAIFRPIHSIKGNSAFFNLICTKKLTHSMENVLDLLRKEAMSVNQAIINCLLEGTDEVRKMLERVKNGEDEIADETCFNSLIARLENLFKTEKETETQLWSHLLTLLEHNENPEIIAISEKLAAISTGGQQALSKFKKKEDEVQPSAQTSEHEKESVHKSTNKTNTETHSAKFMRVSEESVDQFLYFVGELVTIGEMYSHFQTKFASSRSTSNDGAELRRINEIFHHLSLSLQKSILDIRLLPINNILQKVPRIVRDIAVAENKQVDVKITGEHILVDKSIVEALDAPLTHIVRNAIDHGIETAEERIKNNKSATGLIEIFASISGEEVQLTIKDNGKGLNFSALREKAKSLGLIKDDEELSKKDMIELIFKSGVSTAKEITDISGRGVGMDVVKSAIEQKNGSINVDSVEGEGSVFEIKMPLSVSTVIISGLITSVSELNFIFPIENVLRTFALKSEDIVSVMEKEINIKNAGNIYPAIFLSKLLGLEHKGVKSDSMVILVENDEKTTAVLVDEVLGIKQFVLKNIDGIDVENKYIKGATIQGDGSVALVLDIEKLFQ